MDVDLMLRLVTLCIAVWVTTALGAVLLVRAVYARRIERLMREGQGFVPSRAPLSPGRNPPVVARDVTSANDSAKDPFRREHRTRLAVYLAASAVYGLVFGTIWIVKVAVKDDRVDSLAMYLTDPSVVWSAGHNAILPSIASLVLLRVRRFHDQASGIWIAALILVAVPLGAVSIPVSATNFGRVGMRAVVGIAAALAYLRFNGWRALRSRWSFSARRLRAFFMGFGLWWLVSCIIFDRNWIAGLAFLVLPYVAYDLTLRAAFAFLPRTGQRSLLFLRVFGQGAQVDRFYRTLVYDWSNIGPVRLIGAPDVARRTMNPELLTSFVSGKLRKMFHWDQAQLEARISSANRPSIDHVFRTVEVLCSGETWGTAVKRLVRDADVVVMDLRGFSRANLGCAWELGQLANEISLQRVLLCVNQATDAQALHDALGNAWKSVAADSPNWQTLDPFQIVAVDRSHASIASRALTLASRPKLAIAAAAAAS